jgi:heme-degrading monooxygenase HmoA
MIARLWWGETPADKGEEYARYVEETGVRELRATPGNEGVLVLRRAGKEHAEFGVLSLWSSLDDIEAFAGKDVDRARYYPKDDEFLLSKNPDVDHFEVTTDARP